MTTLIVMGLPARIEQRHGADDSSTLAGRTHSARPGGQPVLPGQAHGNHKRRITNETNS